MSKHRFDFNGLLRQALERGAKSIRFDVDLAAHFREDASAWCVGSEELTAHSAIGGLALADIVQQLHERKAQS